MSTNLPLIWRDRPCPAQRQDIRVVRCQEDYPAGGKTTEQGGHYPGTTCRTFLCRGCQRALPWCFGGTSSQQCDDCEMINEAFSEA